MNYVILDMEWDSVYHKYYKRFVNQILQIGAVKLDEDFNITDIFDVTVKSEISKKVTKRFSELTGITGEMMLAGIPLNEAVSRYNSWLGDDTVTITWSNSDLFTIAENEKYLLEGQKFKIDKYLDLQKFIQNKLRLSGYETNSQISLAHAAEALGITTSGYDLHTAKDDSLICAAILKEHCDAISLNDFIKDTADPEFYRRMHFKTHYLSDLNDKLINKQTLVFCCEKCLCEMNRQSKWRYRNNWFSANFVCKSCNKKFICRVSYKKTYDDLIVKRRILEPKSKESRENSNAVQPVSTTV